MLCVLARARLPLRLPRLVGRVAAGQGRGSGGSAGLVGSTGLSRSKVTQDM